MANTESTGSLLLSNNKKALFFFRNGKTTVTIQDENEKEAAISTLTDSDRKLVNWAIKAFKENI